MKERSLNNIHLSLLAVGTLTVGLILANATEKQDNSRLNAHPNVPEASGLLFQANPKVADIVGNSPEVASSYQRDYQNFENTLEFMKKSGDRGLEFAAYTSIPLFWSSTDREQDDYFKAEFVQTTENGPTELKIVINMGTFNSNLSEEQITDAAIDLYRARYLYEEANKDINRFRDDAKHRQRLISKASKQTPQILKFRA